MSIERLLLLMTTRTYRAGAFLVGCEKSADAVESWKKTRSWLCLKGVVRTSFSTDALTGMEANLRFAGPETIESKIFARLSAWQNWIFQRPNAVGEQGALKRYGSGLRPVFDRERV